MNTLVVFFAAIACTVADPQILLGNTSPLFHRSIIDPLTVTTGNVFTTLPNYYGLKSLYLDRDLLGLSRFGLVDRSVLPVPVEDTWEVKLAKAAHFEEVEKAKLRGKRDIRVIPGIHPHIVSPLISRVDYPHIVPAALPTTHTVPIVKTDGFLDETPEVKIAKHHHLLEVEAAKIRNLTPLKPIGYPYIPYHSVFPLPGEDTLEVKLAKIAHFQEVEKAKYRGRRDIRVIPGIHPQIVSPLISRIDYPHIVPAALPTTNTVPMVKKDGFLDDTPEVKFAKGHHLLQVEAAKIRNLTPIKPIGWPYIPYSTIGYPFTNRVLGF